MGEKIEIDIARHFACKPKHIQSDHNILRTNLSQTLKLSVILYLFEYPRFEWENEVFKANKKNSNLPTLPQLDY